MRILGIGESCDLGDLYLRLAAAGHEVRVYVDRADARDIFDGMVEKTPDWRNDLEWIGHAISYCFGPG